MNILSRIFGKKENKETPVKRSGFSIEYYPLTGRYYPKYGNCYMIESANTGIIEKAQPYLFPYAEYSKTEEGAEMIIEQFREQQLKENVITINK